MGRLRAICVWRAACSPHTTFAPSLLLRPGRPRLRVVGGKSRGVQVDCCVAGGVRAADGTACLCRFWTTPKEKEAWHDMRAVNISASQRDEDHVDQIKYTGRACTVGLFVGTVGAHRGWVRGWMPYAGGVCTG